MYSVVASNGQTYGPVDLETLKNWCREGRVVPTSTIVDAASGASVKASDMPALQDVFPQAVAPAMQPPGTQPTGQPGPGAQPMSAPGVNVSSGPYYSPSPYGQTAGARPYIAPKSSKSKVVAFLLAFFFLGWFGVHRFYLGHKATGGAMLFLLVLGVGLIFGGGALAASQVGPLQPGQQLSQQQAQGALGGGVMFLAGGAVLTILGLWVLIDWILILAGVLKDADGYDLS